MKIVCYKICWICIYFMACSSNISSNKTSFTPIVINTPDTNVIATANVSIIQKTLKSNWHIQWLKGIPCALPCFENITPGKDSYADTLVKLPNSELIDHITDDSNTTRKFINWDWNGQRDGGSVNFQREDNIVSNIQPRFPVSITFGELRRYLGEPTYIIAEAKLDMHDQSRILYSMEFVWLERGFRSRPLLGNFSSPPSYDDAMEMAGFVIFDPIKLDAESKKVMQPWAGKRPFVEYCLNTAQLKNLCLGKK